MLEEVLAHMPKMLSWTTWVNAKLSAPLQQKETQIVSRCWSCKASSKSIFLSKPTYLSTPHQLRDPLCCQTFVNAHGLVVDVHHPIAKLWLLMETESMHFKATLARKWDLLQMRDVWIIAASCHVCGAFTFERAQSKESGKILGPLRPHIKH